MLPQLATPLAEDEPLGKRRARQAVRWQHPDSVAEDALDEPDPDDGAYEPDVRSYELPVPAGGAGAYGCVG